MFERPIRIFVLQFHLRESAALEGERASASGPDGSVPRRSRTSRPSFFSRAIDFRLRAFQHPFHPDWQNHSSENRKAAGSHPRPEEKAGRRRANKAADKRRIAPNVSRVDKSRSAGPAAAGSAASRRDGADSFRNAASAARSRKVITTPRSKLRIRLRRQASAPSDRSPPGRRPDHPQGMRRRGRSCARSAERSGMLQPEQNDVSDAGETGGVRPAGAEQEEEQIARAANAPNQLPLVSLNRLMTSFVSRISSKLPSWRTFSRDSGQVSNEPKCDPVTHPAGLRLTSCRQPGQSSPSENGDHARDDFSSRFF